MIAREPTQVQGIHHREAEEQQFRIADCGMNFKKGLERTTKHKSAIRNSQSAIFEFGVSVIAT
jgi:hypothetical protein